MSDFWFGVFFGLAAWSTIDFLACLRYRGAVMEIDDAEVRRTRLKALIFITAAFVVGAIP